MDVMPSQVNSPLGIEKISPWSRVLLTGFRQLPEALGGASCFRKFCRRNRGRPYRVRTTREFLFAGELGDSVDNRIAVQLDYEPGLSDFIAKEVSGAGGFLDIGCNVGWFSTLVASLPSRPEQVVSVDANPRMVECCRNNLRLNHFSGEVVCCALGPNRGRVTFHIPEKRHSRASLGLANTQGFGATREIEVEMVPLADLLERFPEGRCDLIKMDIEGYELATLREVPVEVIRRVGTIVLEYSQSNLKGCGFGGMTLGVLPWLEEFSVRTLDEQGRLETIETPHHYSPEETTFILRNRRW